MDNHLKIKFYRFNQRYKIDMSIIKARLTKLYTFNWFLRCQNVAIVKASNRFETCASKYE